MPATPLDQGSRRAPTLGWLLLAAYGLSRLLLAVLADTPEVYRGNSADVVGDPLLYEQYARQLMGGAAAYSGVRIEYPPGILPIITVPALLVDLLGQPVTYRSAYITLMIGVDALGLVGVARLGQRWGTRTGAWAWTVGVLALGPISYVRLDLVPAVATIWALERAAAGRPFAAGGWLGAGVVTKLYPGVLAVAMLVAITRRRALVLGGLLVAGLPVAVFLGVLPAMVDAVLGYHLERGIQVESTWATPFLLAARQGRELEIPFEFGAYHIRAPLTELAKRLASVATVGVLAVSVLLARRQAPDDVPALAATLCTTMLLLLATASVFSPQYVVWAVAAASVAVAAPRSPLRLPALLLVPAGLLSQAVYPLYYNDMLTLGTRGLTVLTARNLIVVAAAVLALVATLRATRAAAVAPVARPPDVLPAGATAASWSVPATEGPS